MVESEACHMNPWLTWPAWQSSLRHYFECLAAQLLRVTVGLKRARRLCEFLESVLSSRCGGLKRSALQGICRLLHA